MLFLLPPRMVLAWGRGRLRLRGHHNTEALAVQYMTK
jgi:hypothetical protein